MMKSYLIFLTITNTGILAQFLDCAKNEDCIAKDAVCTNSLCHCPKDQVYSMDNTMCLERVFGYNADCVEDQQCSWLMGKYMCNNGKCQCGSGWVFYMGKCIPRGYAKRECPKTGDCSNGYDPLAMVCKNNVCECNDGYYLRGDNDCRPISAIDDYCSLDSDCQFTNGGCVNSFCKTTQKSINANLTQLEKFSLEVFRVTKLDIMCSSNAECSTVPNSLCNLDFGKCLCKRGYRYVAEKSKCVAELGSSSGCAENSDCELQYTRCLNGKCYCRKSYFSIDGNMVCQKPMTHDNFFCNNNERCYVLGIDGVCENNKCGCSSAIAPNEDFLCETIGCESSEDCGQLVNSICVDKVCQCPDNFYLENKRCLPELGSACSESAPCNIANGNCNNDVCSCSEGFVQNGKVCSKLATGINATCEIEKQCTSVPNTMCVNQQCQCIPGYLEIRSKCIMVRAMGDACSTTSECLTFLGKNVSCRNGYCICPVDMVPDITKFDCESSSNLTSVTYSVIVLLLVFNFVGL